ncbi:recombinase RecT [Leucobacter aridicollis]|uniref:recombinase RecT n=1 Tax=Leucobacter aridicollis TaxID=283878 RepID=UPI00216996A0|nr:recombinase RecT [Leucobacter aridicollis]MCS3426706.1 recombination protein RecT [Leucobacter aridicollis]
MSDLTQAAVAVKKNPTIEDYLTKYEPEFQRALGKTMDAAKFSQDALTAIKQTPKLRECDTRTLFGALFLAAQLKLPVGGPLAQFHLTPRKRGDVWEVLPIIGYGGYIQLIMNTGLYSKVGAFLVHEADYFDEGANSERGEFYDFKKARADRGAVVGVVAYVKVKGYDESQYVYLDAETMRERHRPRFWEKTPWKSDEGEMFKKTGLRMLQKMLPKQVEAQSLALAASADQASVKKVDGVEDLTIQHDVEDAEVVSDDGAV